MYTVEELNQKRYNDLFKIAKSLGIRGGRQKTAKLVTYILQVQENGSASSVKNESNFKSSCVSDNQCEMLEDIRMPDDFVESSSESSESDGHSKQQTAELRSPITATTRVDKNTLSALKCEDKPVDRRQNYRRSNTFEIEKRESPDIKKVAEVTSQKVPLLKRSGTFEVDPKTDSSTLPSTRRRLTRSSTFELSENETSQPNKNKTRVRSKKLVRSNTFDKSNDKSVEISAPLECSGKRKTSKDGPSMASQHKTSFKRQRTSIGNQKVSPKNMIEDIDLSCQEIQTAEDIKNIEEKSPSSLRSMIKKKPCLFKQVSAHERSSSRKSLRGRLLDSTFSAKKAKLYPVGLHSLSKSDVAIATILKVLKVDSKEGPSNSAAQATNSESSPTVKHTRDQQGGSGIPRFISYSRKKMPNFAQIHQQSFGKMESLDDFVKRKHIRTRSNLTGGTPSAVKEVFKPSVTSTNKMDINFTGNRTPGAFGRKSNARKSIISTEIKNNESTTFDKEDKAKITKSEDVSQKKEARTLKLPQNIVVKMPIKENQPPVHSPIQSKSNTSNARLSTPGSLLRRKEYDSTVTKPSLRKGTTATSIPILSTKPTLRKQNSSIKNAVNRDVLKNIIGKNPKIKSSDDLRQSQKVFLKGVRLNKRFALQMAKRGINIA